MPTIGTLFLLNFIAAIVIAIGLLAPIRRVVGKHTNAVRAAIAIAGIGLAVGSLAGLFISETTGLFDFVEHGYRMAIVVEAAATVFLVAFLAANARAFRRSTAGRDEARAPDYERARPRTTHRVIRSRPIGATVNAHSYEGAT